MKKVISIILTMMMIFSACTPSYAVEPVRMNVITIEGGHLYTAINNGRTIVILTHDEKHLVDISIAYPMYPNIVYQWSITDYPVPVFAPDEMDFWVGIVDYAEDRMDSANVVHFSESPIRSWQPHATGASGRDLKADLEKITGLVAYENREIFSDTYKGERFTIYETVDFEFLVSSSQFWRFMIGVPALMIGVFVLASTGSLIIGVCALYGIVASVYLMAFPDTMNTYTCRVIHYQYVTINDSQYVYNITDQVIDYTGYEDMDLNSRERAYIDKDSRKVYYTDGESYFQSYQLQIEDAYDMFLTIGQMPSIGAGAPAGL